MLAPIISMKAPKCYSRQHRTACRRRPWEISRIAGHRLHFAYTLRVHFPELLLKLNAAPSLPPTCAATAARTDRNLLLGFFALLLLVGGALIWWLYGGSAAAVGVVCIVMGAGLAGAVLLITLGFQWLSDWLDRRAEQGELAAAFRDTISTISR
jgi:hypothetical protein